MKIEYNILWLDDAKKEIEEGEYHEELYNYIEILGFRPRINIVRTEGEFFRILKKAEWDLILTDYNLDELKENPEKGDKVIKKIRDEDVQTEILFYTKKDDGNRKIGFDRITFIDTSKMMGETHNEKVLDKAKELVDITVRKFQHIVVMRGMIMHETSELDTRLLEICENHIKDEYEDLIDTLFDQIISHHQSKVKAATKYKRNNRIDKLYKDHVMFSFSKKADAVELLIEKLGLSNFIDSFKHDIIKPRNQFAHIIFDVKENIFKTKNGIKFNDEKCKQIRKDLIKHIGNIENLKNELD